MDDKMQSKGDCMAIYGAGRFEINQETGLDEFIWDMDMALSILEKHDAALLAKTDEELVEGLGKWMLEEDSSAGLQKIAVWEKQDDANRKHYLDKARAAIQNCREKKG